MGSIVAPVVGAIASENQRNDANAARRAALQLYGGIQVPSIADQEVNYGTLNNIGDLQNQSEQALGMSPSAMEGISTDPRLAEAQMQALNQLSQTGQMGMTPGEQAALRDAQRQASALAQAKTAQIQDQYARMGMGGSGAQLAAQLQAAQSGADRASQNSNQIAQQAQQAALQAIGQSGQLAGQIQGQQFGQKSDIARAKDYINQFNTQNQQGVQQRNVANANAANLRNLTNKQNIANQNVGISNSQQDRNKALIQQQYNNQMSRAAGMAGQYQGIAGANDQQAGRNADMWAGIGRGVDTGAGALYNAYNRNSKQPHEEGSDFADYELD